MRITSSNVGKIAKRRKSTPVGNLVHQLLYTTFRGNASTAWGLSQEEASSHQYLKWLREDKESPTARVTINCGLVISTSYPWLAATPDGWVEDPKATPTRGIVEFKNPHSYKDTRINEAIMNKKCTCLCVVDGERSLKQSHDYYHQIQFAMFCTNTKWCDFCLRTLVDVHCERIYLNTEYCSSRIPSLRKFYFCAILPELALPKDPIREPREWIVSEQDWLQRVSSPVSSLQTHSTTHSSLLQLNIP